MRITFFGGVTCLGLWTHLASYSPMVVNLFRWYDAYSWSFSTFCSFRRWFYEGRYLFHMSWCKCKTCCSIYAQVFSTIISINFIMSHLIQSYDKIYWSNNKNKFVHVTTPTQFVQCTIVRVSLQTFGSTSILFDCGNKLSKNTYTGKNII